MPELPNVISEAQYLRYPKAWEDRASQGSIIKVVDHEGNTIFTLIPTTLVEDGYAVTVPLTLEAFERAADIIRNTHTSVQLDVETPKSNARGPTADRALERYFGDHQGTNQD